MIAEPPNNVPVAEAIVVIKFDEPILVTAGDDEIAVVSGIEDGVSVRPVWIRIRTPIGVQVVELVPGPDDVVILVHINNHVSRGRGSVGQSFC